MGGDRKHKHSRAPHRPGSAELLGDALSVVVDDDDDDESDDESEPLTLEAGRRLLEELLDD